MARSHGGVTLMPEASKGGSKRRRIEFFDPVRVGHHVCGFAFEADTITLLKSHVPVCSEIADA